MHRSTGTSDHKRSDDDMQLLSKINGNLVQMKGATYLIGRSLFCTAERMNTMVEEEYKRGFLGFLGPWNVWNPYRSIKCRQLEIQRDTYLNHARGFKNIFNLSCTIQEQLLKKPLSKIIKAFLINRQVYLEACEMDITITQEDYYQSKTPIYGTMEDFNFCMKYSLGDRNKMPKCRGNHIRCYKDDDPLKTPNVLNIKT